MVIIIIVSLRDNYNINMYSILYLCIMHQQGAFECSTKLLYLKHWRGVNIT